jgi:hypothetical protein
MWRQCQSTFSTMTGLPIRNSDRQCDILIRLREKGWGAPTRQCARAHRFRLTVFGLQKYDSRCSLPPYSPNLVPRDFFLFPEMTVKLKGWRFDPAEKMQAESQKLLKTLSQKAFQDNLSSWQKRWHRYVRYQKDDFEGTEASTSLILLFLIHFRNVWIPPRRRDYGASTIPVLMQRV